MTNVRVHELAKELNLSSKDIINKLVGLGVDVKNHLSAVEKSDADRLRAQLGGRPHNSAPKDINTDREPLAPRPSEEVRAPRPEIEGKSQGLRPGIEGRPPQGP
ncbi:MAG: translation initiation factor IF-2 N-terminal domain-containing protein, partial [Desulfitobacterium hafniense]|nr:translation initiation factor IF-2 N-terminal domain-containing protein [Desulfitobacterium hafniense]